LGRWLKNWNVTLSHLGRGPPILTPPFGRFLFLKYFDSEKVLYEANT
jgi:hypothetical protein